MKRIICFIIVLCLCFGAISPVFAITETVDQGANTKLTNIYDKLTAFTAFFTSWWGHDGSLDSTTSEGSFQMLAINVANLTQMFERWIMPNDPTNALNLGIWDFVHLIAYKVNEYWDTWDSYLGNLPSIASYVSSWMNNNNTYLSQLVGSAPLNSGNGLLRSLTNYLYIRNNYSNTIAEIYQSAHRALGFQKDDNSGLYNLLYGVNSLNSDGTISTVRTNWNWGTPIGNIAWILQQGISSLSNFGNGILLNAKENLATWEHSTNTQTSFTPTSLANGLYRYLAYIQSDTGQGFYKLFYGIPSVFKRNKNQFADGSYTQLEIPYNSLGYVLTSMLNDDYGALHNINQGYNLGSYLRTNMNLSTNNVTYRSTDHLLSNSLANIIERLTRLAFVHADDTDIAMKRQEAANDTAVANNFFGSGSAAASASDFGDIASASAAAKSNLSTGVSASGVWAVFNDPNWSYLTQATADSLMPTQLTRSEAISYNYETPYLDRYTEAVYNIIGFSTDELYPEDEQR